MDVIVIETEQAATRSASGMTAFSTRLRAAVRFKHRDRDTTRQRPRAPS
jgi:hypothetical protein